MLPELAYLNFIPFEFEENEYKYCNKSDGNQCSKKEIHMAEYNVSNYNMLT